MRVALNSRLHQVESAFETREHSAARLRQFVADASHEPFDLGYAWREASCTTVMSEVAPTRTGGPHAPAPRLT